MHALYLHLADELFEKKEDLKKATEYYDLVAERTHPESDFANEKLHNLALKGQKKAHGFMVTLRNAKAYLESGSRYLEGDQRKTLKIVTVSFEGKSFDLQIGVPYEKAFREFNKALDIIKEETSETL